jgi:hypothetical protein
MGSVALNSINVHGLFAMEFIEMNYSPFLQQESVRRNHGSPAKCVPWLNRYSGFAIAYESMIIALIFFSLTI